MGKLYKADIDEIRIEDGVLKGVTITDNFSSANQETKGKRAIESATFTLDGMAIEEVVQFLWDAYKVKAQARTWKFMSDREFLALDGETHDGLQFIPKADKTSTKTSILTKAQATQQKMFYEKALEKAMDALDDDASNEDITAWAQQYYDDEYKDIIEMMVG